MELSISFIFILIFIIFPGLIFRRLYFYGEFSKQFNSNHSLISLLAISSLPGVIISLISFILYTHNFKHIDLALIVDYLKDINNPTFKIHNNTTIELNKTLTNEVSPYIIFQYLIASISGILCGRLIRISRLDTKFKILQFKNIWFYIFNGQYSNFKKNKHLKQKNKKHLFTKADVLIDTNSKTYLYSGIVIDYEISDSNCSALTKVILKNAERYTIRNNEKVKVEIPGTLLVVDCSTMKNINLTYIYEDSESILKTKVPYIIEVSLGLFIIFLIPFYIFKSDMIEIDLYKQYFELKWYQKIFAYLFSIQIITLLNPFEKIKDEYSFVSWKSIIAKIVLLIIFYILI